MTPKLRIHIDLWHRVLISASRDHEARRHRLP